MSVHRTIIGLITVAILLFSCEASSFRRRHQVKILAVAEGDQDVQPVEKTDSVPSVTVSSESQHSMESIVSGGEQEPLTTPKSPQLQDANSLPRTRLLQRARPSCDSEIIGMPEKRLTEDQLKMAKLEKEAPKVNPVDDSQLESEVKEVIRKVKKSQKLRRQQQQKINVEEPEGNGEEDAAEKATKSQQSDNVDVQPVENSKTDADAKAVLQENENAQLTESELKKYRRSSRRKSKKSTTTTTTTPPPESEESSEETAENDEELEYVNPDSELEQHPPEHEGSNEETKDEDPNDGPVSKAISGDAGAASVTALENSASSNEQEQHVEDDIMESRDKISKKDRRSKSKRGERPSFNDQLNYRQARRRYGNRNNEESGDGM